MSLLPELLSEIDALKKKNAQLLAVSLRLEQRNMRKEAEIELSRLRVSHEHLLKDRATLQTSNLNLKDEVKALKAQIAMGPKEDPRLLARVEELEGELKKSREFVKTLVKEKEELRKKHEEQLEKIEVSYRQQLDAANQRWMDKFTETTLRQAQLVEQIDRLIEAAKPRLGIESTGKSSLAVEVCGARSEHSDGSPRRCPRPKGHEGAHEDEDGPFEQTPEVCGMYWWGKNDAVDKPAPNRCKLLKGHMGQHTEEGHT